MFLVVGGAFFGFFCVFGCVRFFLLILLKCFWLFVLLSKARRKVLGHMLSCMVF